MCGLWDMLWWHLTTMTIISLFEEMVRYRHTGHVLICVFVLLLYKSLIWVNRTQKHVTYSLNMETFTLSIP